MMTSWIRIIIEDVAFYYSICSHFSVRSAWKPTPNFQTCAVTNACTPTADCRSVVSAAGSHSAPWRHWPNIGGFATRQRLRRLLRLAATTHSTTPAIFITTTIITITTIAIAALAAVWFLRHHLRHFPHHLSRRWDNSRWIWCIYTGRLHR